ncbi:MAG TPA: HD domain-containing phosphohydrolase [Mariprofundaceae bacterium]|nr:HD domain-containing phosphohydrolase [Mariprofundaceae bacterium]
MSTYIDMLRAQKAKQEAAAEKSGDHPGPQTPDQPPSPAPREEAPLLADDDGTPLPHEGDSPLADEALDFARTARMHIDRGPSASTHMDMLRAHRERSGSAGAGTPAASLSEEPQQQRPHAMMQDEFQGTSGEAGGAAGAFEATVPLADETSDRPSHATLDLTESDGATTQAAWLSGCVALLLRIYEDAGHNVPSDLSPLLMHLERFTDAVYEDIERLNALELEISNHIDEFREQHITCGDLLEKAVMMMLYGIKVCMQMHMEPREITRHVAASMLHNIGMALILVDTRLKESTLSDVERALIRRTPEKSVEYLKDCSITDPVLLQAAEQAQERFDGSGPHGLSGSDIALSARITGLLSMFEALVHFRAYRERLLPRDAIRELVNRYKNQFDPAILKVLIESVSLYPVGTYVQLNSGDVGQVIRVQPRLPLRPRILLTLDKHGKKIQPREVDLREQPNLMVQRCMYAAGLASLKQDEDRG